jgi:epoxyqueuosine reductase
MWRAKRRGFLRNVAIAMGNQRLPEFLPALLNALCDAEPLVRGAVAWALGQYREPSISAILRERLASEEDANVREELLAALSTSENDEDLTTHPQSL